MIGSYAPMICRGGIRNLAPGQVIHGPRTIFCGASKWQDASFPSWTSELDLADASPSESSRPLHCHVRTDLANSGSSRTPTQTSDSPASPLTPGHLANGGQHPTAANTRTGVAADTVGESVPTGKPRALTTVSWRVNNTSCRAARVPL
jgi:hypothetical protein